jgi:hypothetical protein
LCEPDFSPSREAVVPDADWPSPMPAPSMALDTLRTLDLTQGNKNQAVKLLRRERTTLIETNCGSHRGAASQERSQEVVWALAPSAVRPTTML